MFVRLSQSESTSTTFSAFISVPFANKSLGSNTLATLDILEAKKINNDTIFVKEIRCQDLAEKEMPRLRLFHVSFDRRRDAINVELMATSQQSSIDSLNVEIDASFHKRFINYYLPRLSKQLFEDFDKRLINQNPTPAASSAAHSTNSKSLSDSKHVVEQTITVNGYDGNRLFQSVKPSSEPKKPVSDNKPVADLGAAAPKGPK